MFNEIDIMFKTIRMDYIMSLNMLKHDFPFIVRMENIFGKSHPNCDCTF